MSEDRLRSDIRAAFDSTHVPSPGLEDRVVAAIPWTRPRSRKESAPRLAGAAGALLAAVVVVVLATPTVLNRLGVHQPATTAPGVEIAYSLAAADGGSVYVIQRGLFSESDINGVDSNVLLESHDGGTTWVGLLHFAGVYGGMQVYGSAEYVWSIDMQAQGCTTTSCSAPPSQSLYLYRSTDHGATWSAMPRSSFPVEDVYFSDAITGWAVSESPQTGLGSAVLYRTTDRGETWTLVGALAPSSPMSWTFGVGMHRVTFNRDSSGTMAGWYLGQNDLYESRDTGRTWRVVNLPVPAAVSGWTAAPAQPFFNGAEGVLMVAYRKPAGPDNATANSIYLYTSHDGGTTWLDPQPAPRGFAPVGDDLVPTILDPSHVWLTSLSLSAGDNVQAGPAIARTADGGQTWSVFRKTPRILTLTFSDTNHGFALDVTGPTNTNGILATSDGGATWRRITPPVVQ